MGPVRQNPIQRTVNSVHMCVQFTVYNCCTQYCTEQTSCPPDNHHCSDDAYLRERGCPGFAHKCHRAPYSTVLCITHRQLVTRYHTAQRHELHTEKLTWNTAGKLAREFSDEAITDAVLERTKDDDRPAVFHYHHIHTQ